MKKVCVVLFIVSCLAGTVWAEDEASAEGSLPPPEKNEMATDEIGLRILDLDGKVVKTSINYVDAIDQVSEGWYRVWGGWSREGRMSLMDMLVPEQGKGTFHPLLNKGPDGAGTKVVYLLVRSKNPVKMGRFHFNFEAVGTRYNKSKNKYSW